MKRILLSLLLTAVLALSSCGSSPKNEISRALELDLSQGTVLHQEDTHSGLQGDGIGCIVLSFPDGQLEEQLNARTDWNPLPMDPTAATLASEAYLVRADGSPLLPNIQAGYYRLMDRQSDRSEPMLDRWSLNFTLAVYDAEAHTLYYCTMDT